MTDTQKALEEWPVAVPSAGLGPSYSEISYWFMKHKHAIYEALVQQEDEKLAEVERERDCLRGSLEVLGDGYARIKQERDDALSTIKSMRK